jgi:hypothetical protein
MRKHDHPMNSEDALRVGSVDQLLRLSAELPSLWFPLSEVRELGYARVSQYDLSY